MKKQSKTNQQSGEQKKVPQNTRNAASIVESSNDAIITQNIDSIITGWNAAAERMYGYLAEEIIGQSFLLIVPPENIGSSTANHSGLRGGYKVEPHDLVRLRKDGSSILVSVSASPIYDESGVVIGRSSTHRDVTGEKKAMQHARNAALIIQTSNDAIMSVDMDSIITGWNPAAERMFGYLAEEAIGQLSTLLVPPEAVYKLDVILSDLRAGNKVVSNDIVRLRKDGSSIRISLVASPIYDESGAIIGRLSTYRDLTQEKEAAHRARNMRMIIDSSNDAIMSVDMDAIVTSWNKAAERMFGYRAQEIKGRPISLIIPPENTHEEVENQSKILGGYNSEPYETLRIRKDGSSIPISLTVSPIYDESGAIIGRSSIARDITEQKQASQYARNMASIVESSSDAITSVNLESVIISWNPAAERIYGYSAEEMIGQSFSILIPPENTHESGGLESNIWDGSTIKRYETRRIREDGSSIPISLSVSAIYDESGAVIGSSAIARDFTEQQEASKDAYHMTALIDSSNNAITSASLEGIFLTWNPAGERMYGYLAKEMIGQPISILIPPENTHREPDIKSNIRDGSTIKRYETLRIGKDGSTIPISLSVSPIYNESGAVIGASSIAWDSTEQKESSQNARRMALIIESFNDAITSVNTEGVTSWNPAGERIYGYSAEEMIGQPFSPLLSPEKTHENAENLSKIQDGDRIEPYETLRIRKDGRTISILLTVSPIYDVNGVAIGSSAIHRDITEQKEASQNARIAALILESSSDAITSSSPLAVTSWNPAAERMYGYLAEEMIGHTSYQLIPPEKLQEMTDNWNKIRNGYKVEPYETLRIRKDGSIIPVSITSSPIFSENGAFIGSSSIARDITEHKRKQVEILQLNASLIEADKVKDGFIENMNHELRTPLTSIVGYMELIIGYVDSGVEPELASWLATVERNSLQLQILIENLTQVSKTDFKQVSLVIDTVDVGHLLGGVVKTVELSAGDCGVEVTLRLDSPTSDLLIDGDANQLERVFVNLLHNAIKFTPREGKATIVVRRAHTDGGYVEVTVTDTGIGIPPDEFPNVFKRFFRASTATQASIPGTGIGLWLAHSNVREHHGTVTFDSTVGKGTVFTVRLPVRFMPTGLPDQTT